MDDKHVETLFRIDENVKHLKSSLEKLDSRHDNLESRQRSLEKKWWVIVGTAILTIMNGIKSWMTGH